MGIFPDAQGQLTPQSLVRSGRISYSSEILWLVTCKNEEDPIKNEGARVLTIFPHYNPLGAICCHETRVPILPGPELMQSIPHPNDASNKSSGPHGLREEDFYIFSYCITMGDDEPGEWPI